jgi:hypothetical protein
MNKQIKRSQKNPSLLNATRQSPIIPIKPPLRDRIEAGIEQFKKDTRGKSWENLAQEAEAKGRF